MGSWIFDELRKALSTLKFTGDTRDAYGVFYHGSRIPWYNNSASGAYYSDTTSCNSILNIVKHDFDTSVSVWAEDYPSFYYVGRGMSNATDGVKGFGEGRAYSSPRFAKAPTAPVTGIQEKWYTYLYNDGDTSVDFDNYGFQLHKYHLLDQSSTFVSDTELIADTIGKLTSHPLNVAPAYSCPILTDQNEYINCNKALWAFEWNFTNSD